MAVDTVTASGPDRVDHWQLDRGVPEVVAARVTASQRVIQKHYDKQSAVEKMEQRRRPHIDNLTIG